MRRGILVTATFAAVAAAGLAFAQPASPPAQQPPVAAPGVRAPGAPEHELIAPRNALERAFVTATDETGTDAARAAARAEFRRLFLSSQVALALSSTTPDAPPRQIEVHGAPTTLIFTSSARATEVMGAQSPRVILTGREALARVRGANVIVNINLRPFLALDAEGVESFIALPVPAAAPAPAQPAPPTDSAGPSQ